MATIVLGLILLFAWLAAFFVFLRSGALWIANKIDACIVGHASESALDDALAGTAPIVNSDGDVEHADRVPRLWRSGRRRWAFAYGATYYFRPPWFYDLREAGHVRLPHYEWKSHGLRRRIGNVLIRTVLSITFLEGAFKAEPSWPDCLGNGIATLNALPPAQHCEPSLGMQIHMYALPLLGAAIVFLIWHADWLGVTLRREGANAFTRKASP